MIMVLFLSLALIHLMVFSQVIRLNYEMDDLSERIEEMRNKNKELFNEAARLSALDRIERIATTKLGMVKPGKIKFIWQD